MENETNPIAKGFKQGLWFMLAIGSVWAVTAFAAAAWWALPNAGTTLSSSAWNDIVSQLNTLAGAMNVSSGNVGVGIAPTAKLDVNGDVVIRWGMTSPNFGTTYSSVMPNDMSFAGGWSVMASATPALPIWTYFFQIYGCNWQNNFTSWVLADVVFSSWAGSATGIDYFDNANVWGGSCGYFRSWLIKVSTAWSTVRLRLTSYLWGANADQNPSANSMQMNLYRIY